MLGVNPIVNANRSIVDALEETVELVRGRDDVGRLRDDYANVALQKDTMLINLVL